MDVARDRECGDRPVEGSSAHDRELALEVELALEEKGPAVAAADRRPVGEAVRVRQANLASAVVATERRLEPEWITQLVRGPAHIRERPHLAPRSRRHVQFGKETSLREPIMSQFERP